MMMLLDFVLVLLICSSKTLGQGYNYPVPQPPPNDGTTPENQFISTPTMPTFGYPLKDSPNVPQTNFEGGFGSDGTTPISSAASPYGGNNQRPGGAIQPEGSGFASSAKGYPASSNFPQRSQPSNGVRPTLATGQNSGRKPSNGYSSNSGGFNGYSSGPSQTNGKGYQNSGNDFNHPNGNGFEDTSNNLNGQDQRHEDGSFGLSADEEGDYSAIPGQPDLDYPVLSSIPDTSFQCSQQEFPGYYADIETRCQVFHVCASGKTYDFLCPNGTIFHQEFLVCVWWNLFDCSLAPSFYGVNANLYVSQPQAVDDQGAAFAPTGPGYGSTGPNGYHSDQPAKQTDTDQPTLSPQVPRFPLNQNGKSNGATQKPQRPNNGFSSYGQTEASLPEIGDLPLNDYNQNQPSSNGYQQDTTSTSPVNGRTNKQKSRNGYNQNQGYNYGNNQQLGVNEEQHYQANQNDRNNNEFQTGSEQPSSGATNGGYSQQSSYQGSQQRRGYLPPVGQ